MIWSYV